MRDSALKAARLSRWLLWNSPLGEWLGRGRPNRLAEPVAVPEWCVRCDRTTRHMVGLSVLGFPEQGCTVCTRTVDYRWQDAGPLVFPPDWTEENIP